MTDVTALVRFTPLLDVLRRQQPNLAELMEYNARGTIQLLVDYDAIAQFNAIEFYSGVMENMTIKHTGRDPKKTWSDYKKIIENYWRNVCFKSRNLSQYVHVLNSAIDILSKHLWDKYYEEYPKWPSVGEENRAFININKTDAYRDGSYVVVWNCLGQVMVEDTRPDGDYMANIKGSPIIKVLFMEARLLNQLEDIVETEGFEVAKVKVNEKSRRGVKALTFKDI